MIWCVDSDAASRNMAVYALQAAGFEAEGYPCAESFWNALQNQKPELVLMDTLLPGVDCIELIKRIRTSGAAGSMPIIMSARNSSEIDVIRCLDSGADDCLGKPFGMMEMLSRVKAVLRRYKPAAEKERMLRVGQIVLSLRERTVWVDGEKVELTYKEFELLHLLMSNPGEVFSREQLYEKIWGKSNYCQTRTVDIHIQTLRKKLGPWGSLIACDRTVGYRIRKIA